MKKVIILLFFLIFSVTLPAQIKKLEYIVCKIDTSYIIKKTIFPLVLTYIKESVDSVYFFSQSEKYSAFYSCMLKFREPNYPFEKFKSVTVGIFYPAKKDKNLHYDSFVDSVIDCPNQIFIEEYHYDSIKIAKNGYNLIKLIIYDKLCASISLVSIKFYYMRHKNRIYVIVSSCHPKNEKNIKMVRKAIRKAWRNMK